MIFDSIHDVEKRLGKERERGVRREGRVKSQNCKGCFQSPS